MKLRNVCQVDAICRIGQRCGNGVARSIRSRSCASQSRPSRLTVGAGHRPEGRPYPILLVEFVRQVCHGKSLLEFFNGSVADVDLV